MSPSSDASEPFLAETKYRDSDGSEDWESGTPEVDPRARWLPWLGFGILLLLLTNATTYFLVIRTQINFDKICASYTSKWSPIIRDVDIKYETAFFNSTIYGDKDSIYRQQPSREVDEAWNALGVDIAPMIITEEEAIKSGIGRDRVRLDEKDGGPGYPVIVEGLHNLHCLNLLRQALYFNHEKYHEWKEGAWKNEEPILQLHIGHCLNMLRIVLMCNPDTGVHPFVWAKHSSNASYPAHVFPDFQRPHKCKNFDDILQYAKTSKSLTAGTVDIFPKKGSLILPDWP